MKCRLICGISYLIQAHKIKGYISMPGERMSLKRNLDILKRNLDILRRNLDILLSALCMFL